MSFYDDIEKQNTLKLREQLKLLPDFCKQYFISIEPRTTSKTRISYAYDLIVFFNYIRKSNPTLKNKKLTLDDIDNISFMDIEEYMEYLKYYTNDNNINEKTNSLEGIKRKIASLRSFYKYFYNNELIKNNPASKITLPKLREKEIIRLDNDEINKLLDIVETGNNLSENEKKFNRITNLRDTTLLSLLLGTGIRVSECVGINISDIDIKKSGIKIKRKGAKEAIVYFSDEVKTILEKYLKYRKSIENVLEKDDDALFLSLQKKRISVRAVEKLVKKYALKIAPLKHITPHKLRSTFGTNLYKATDDIYLVASVLGHNDVNTTRKHYTAIEDDKKRSARNKISLRDN